MADDFQNQLMILVASAFTTANWIAAWVMLRAYLDHRENRLLWVATLRGIARAAGVTVSLIAWVDIINDFQWFGQDGVIFIVFLALVGVALPSIYFLYLYWTDQFVAAD